MKIKVNKYINKLYAISLQLLMVVLFAVNANSLTANEDHDLGKIILEVDGAISNSNYGPSYAFDIELIKQLPATELKTSTVWTNGAIDFKGVELFEILKLVGAKGTRIIATALNDYSVEIPTSDGVKGGAILAYSMNGQEMSVRDKGPLWVIYPYDQDDKYRNSAIYARSIWQLKTFNILP